MDSYSTSKNAQSDTQYNNLDQKVTDFQLASNTTELRVTCSFINNQLREVYLSQLEGELILTQPATKTVDLAKGLLERYQNYVGDSLYGELASTLSNVDENQNLTKTIGNTRLKVLNLDQRIVDYTWTYVDQNGVEAQRKNVELLFEQGQLKGFLNNWPLYKVVAAPKISVEEARTIAIEASKDFSYQTTTANGTTETVSGFKIDPKSLGHESLIYLNLKNQSEARGNDPFTLYPAWFVPLGFNGFYPGGVSSMTVTLWADTGEVVAMQEVIVDSGLGLSTESNTITVQEQQLAQGLTYESNFVPIFIVLTIFCVIGVSVGALRNTTFAYRKFFHPRLWAILFCFMIFLSIIFMAVPSVKADVPASISKSRVYSCEDTPNGYDQGGPVDQAEKAAAASLCNTIGNMTSDAGYDTTNWHGAGTTVYNVEHYAGTDEQNYLRTAVFHVGHLCAFNTAYQDNWGDAITDTNIYSQTGLGRHFFVFLWVCSQAMTPQWDDPTPGMPIAWTHRDNGAGRPYMSSNGYADPDGEGQCYISFQGQSPMISNYHDVTFYDCGNIGPAMWFINFFYYFALVEDYSVNDALDQASDYYFGCYFPSSVLNQGFSSWWPGGNFTAPLNNSGFYPESYQGYYDPDKPLNRLAVFGDGDIYLCQHLLSVNAKDNYGASVSTASFYVDNSYIGQTGSSLYVAPGEHVFYVTVPAGYSFANFTFTFAPRPTNYRYVNPVTMDIFENCTLTAYFNVLPTQFTISASSDAYSSISPSGQVSVSQGGS